MSIERVLSDLAGERVRQDGAFGRERDKTHTPERWLEILGEQVGHVCRAARLIHAPAYVPGGPRHLRHGLVQVAAVACAWAVADGWSDEEFARVCAEQHKPWSDHVRVYGGVTTLLMELGQLAECSPRRVQGRRQRLVWVASVAVAWAAALSE